MERVAQCRTSPRWAGLLLIAVLLLGQGILTPAGAGATGIYQDPLDQPALMTPRASSELLQALAEAGNRLVAVGREGRILISEDQGASWQQVPSPVSVPLTDVQFVTAEKGWAVGHSGVVLHSTDGGKSWVSKLDGRQAARIFRDFYQRKLDDGFEWAEHYRQSADLNFANGPELPWLGVQFINETHGFLVGAFGLILGTTDGGQSWEPWMHRVDQADDLHFYAVTTINDSVYMVGEQGRVWRLKPGEESFALLQTNYGGTFFGITGNADGLIAFGLRGNAQRSLDNGESWQALDLSGDRYSVTGGQTLDGGMIVLVTQGGTILTGQINAERLVSRPAQAMTPLTAVRVTRAGTMLVAGMRGVSRETLPQ